MMFKIFIIIFLSFILESNLSLFIPLTTNFFNSFLTIASLIIINDITEDNKFYFFNMIIGLLYDLIFINRLSYSILIFLLMGIIIKNIEKIIKTNFAITKYIIIFVIYRLLSFLILLLVGYIDFDLILLFKSIYSSIIINLLYIFILKKIFIKSYK